MIESDQVNKVQRAQTLLLGLKVTVWRRRAYTEAHKIIYISTNEADTLLGLRDPEIERKERALKPQAAASPLALVWTFRRPAGVSSFYFEGLLNFLAVGLF